MRRLIYAPKAYIFIRSSNLNGRVYDVTADVVRGSVTQNLGDVSKATFELRNRYRKWLRDDVTGQSIFLPMDMVTIWLQRIAGRPVQVFTGYLDSVPYYQGYPGNATFEATCTLKKLAFTWFDPGLSFFQQWVMSTGGWTYDPSTGEAQNPQYLSQFETVNPGTLDASGQLSKINDGGFAELLGRFMVEVAGWDNNDVLIADMPKDIPKVAAKLYSQIHDDHANDLLNLAEFLGQMMGIHGYANVNQQTISASNGVPVQNPAIVSVINQIKAVADQSNIPLIVPVLAAYVLTQFDPSFAVPPNMGHSNWGYGLYALQPPNTSVSPLSSDPASLGVFTFTSAIDGKSPQQLADVTVSTQVFCNRLTKYQSTYGRAASNNSLDAIQQWIEKALGRSLPTVDMATIFEKTKQYASMSIVTTPSQSPTLPVDPASVSFDSTIVQNTLNDSDKQVIRDFYKGANPWLAALLYRAKVRGGRTLSPIRPFGGDGSTLMLAGPSGALQKLFTDLTGDASVDAVDMVANGIHRMLASGVETSTKGQAAPGINNVITIRQSKRPASTAPPVAGSDPSNGTSATSDTGGSLPFSSLAAFSANAAFAANFAFPANAQESMMLTGDKALMNDISCLDGAKQFAQGSLRTFRSLPDGRVLFFYPDYFGAYRKPYWKISNLEITNFGIQLNDDALATHVYVVGDTTMGDGKIDPYDEIASRGVATITQALMLNSFIEPYSSGDTSTIGRLHDAYTFLQHYGARPHKEEDPLIRNTFYEFLMAWQRFMQLWSQQFSTTVTFTFQPEVMAGGLIEFPDHEIQMFTESVTHTFDYTSGFETSAVMTAPALTKKGTRDQMPGFALAGGTNTVGAA